MTSMIELTTRAGVIGVVSRDETIVCRVIIPAPVGQSVVCETQCWGARQGKGSVLIRPAFRDNLTVHIAGEQDVFGGTFKRPFYGISNASMFGEKPLKV